MKREISYELERLRRTPPRRGEVHKTLEELAAEQGVGPMDWDWFKANSPGPFYEGFEEDIRRMRRGRRPLGPRKVIAVGLVIDSSVVSYSIAQVIQPRAAAEAKRLDQPAS